MNDADHPQSADPTRRDVLIGVASVAAAAHVGFARAAGPAATTAITTEATGLSTGDVQVPTADRTIPAYVARPVGAGPLPVVVVVQEIFGIHEHIRDVCRRFAREGYLAIAPYLYARQGEVAGLAAIEDVLKIVRDVPDATVMADLDATVRYAGANGGDPARVGITGFCWGGRIVWLYAAHSASLKAGVAWYGRLTGDTTPLQPRFPLDLAAGLRAPVLGLYGGKDKGIPLADVERMQAALTAANSPSTIHVYPDAEHGFHADYRPSFHPEAAKDGFARALAWMRAHGVG
jgi:carboxymethylenebutenolidase